MPRTTLNPSTETPSSCTDATIEVTKGQSVAVRVYGQRKEGAAMPLVVHFHGGAFVSGNLDSGRAVAGLLQAAGARVVSVAYPLSPDHPFPQPQETGYAVLQWAWRHRTKLAGSGAPVYLAGEEAGGNLAAGVCMMARDRSQPPMAGLILLSPLLDPCVATASQRAAKGTQTACKWAEGWMKFLRCARDAEHPYAVPAGAQRLTGLPPTLVLTSDNDPLRDEAQAFADRLEAAGLEVSRHVFSAQSGQWPDALLQPGEQRCPCGPQVQQQFERFFEATRCRVDE